MKPTLRDPGALLELALKAWGRVYEEKRVMCSNDADQPRILTSAEWSAEVRRKVKDLPAKGVVVRCQGGED